jgi:putative ABC transport system permease protein
MTTIIQDLRYAFRQLVKLPGFTFTAVISIALGIGATTAVFSVVYAIIMDPYPYASPDRMIHMRFNMPDGSNSSFGVTGSQWQQLRKSPIVEDTFLEEDSNLTITAGDVPEDVAGVYLTSNGFEFFGVPPLLGRGLVPSDAIDGQDPQPVIVLGYKFWQRHFNSDPSILGKTIQLVRKNYIVVGVAGSRFTWGDADVYLPLKVTGDLVKAYYAGVRLKPGISHAQADSALAPLIQAFEKETPKNFPPDHGKLHVIGLNEDFMHQLGGTLALLFGAVALLLMIGCGNLSILLLARATARQHEFAVRAAIGASRRRVIRQLLTEALLLSLSGAALGLLLAYKTVSIIVANLPEFSFPHEAAIQINVPVLIFCILVAVGTGILFGLSPAWQLSRPEVSQVMQSNSRKAVGNVRGRRVHNALIAGQIALTLVMLAGAGAAIQGFLRLANTHLGYDPHNIMSVGIPLHEGAYKTWEERVAYFEQMHDKVAQIPGVTIAAISTNATPPANGFDTNFDILGKPSPKDQKTRVNVVSREYFPALRIPLMQGRVWDRDEEHRAAGVVVINQTMARRYFPNEDPIGHSLRAPQITSQPPFLLTAPSTEGWFVIIGITADKLNDGLAKPVVPEAFFPYTIALPRYTQVLVRTPASPLALLHTVRVTINSIDRDQQTIGDVRDLEQWIKRLPEYGRGHLVSWLFGAFAGLALALASVGLYSVVSYVAVQRTSEFGLRIALGATRPHVLRLVFSSTALSVGGGIAAGIALTLALHKIMASWAAESSRDPLMLFAATCVLSLVASVACALPAWRASGVDPMKAIRYE